MRPPSGFALLTLLLRTETLAAGSLVVIALTCAAGVAATIWQFTYADNHQ